MNKNLLYKLLKYLSMIVAISLLFKFVPKTPMSDRDIILVAIIAVLLYATSENIILHDTPSQSQCSAECLIQPKQEHVENMASVPAITPPKPVVPSVPSVPIVHVPVKPAEETKKLNIDGMDGQHGSGSDMLFYDIINKDSNIYSGDKIVDYNNLPTFDMTKDKYEYGYSFLPPSNWYPVPPHPPVCVAETRCPVCPVSASGLPADLKEWYVGNENKKL